MLIDSNVLIYAADPNYAFLRELIKDHAPVVSIVSYTGSGENWLLDLKCSGRCPMPPLKQGC